MFIDLNCMFDHVQNDTNKQDKPQNNIYSDLHFMFQAGLMSFKKRLHQQVHSNDKH